MGADRDLPLKRICLTVLEVAVGGSKEIRSGASHLLPLNC
jgi:hypothetical protein